MDRRNFFAISAGAIGKAMFNRGTTEQPDAPLVPYLETGTGNEDRPLRFFGGWHVGVNFACGIQHLSSDGHRYLYAYNCTSTVDKLYDPDSEDATNLINSPEHQRVRDELVRKLGPARDTDPRWVGYWSEFRLARYSSLPKESGDMQMFTTAS